MARTMTKYSPKRIAFRRRAKDIFHVLRGTVCVADDRIASVVLLLGLIIITV